MLSISNACARPYIMTAFMEIAKSFFSGAMGGQEISLFCDQEDDVINKASAVDSASKSSSAVEDGIDVRRRMLLQLPGSSDDSVSSRFLHLHRWGGAS